MNCAVVYSSDENYAKLTLVSMVSLLVNQCEVNFSLYLLANTIQQKTLERMIKTISNLECSLNVIDVTQQLKKITDIGASQYVSYSAYGRLFIHELLPEDTDRVLYLDSDTLIVSPISDVFNLPLNGHAFAIGYDFLCNRYKKLVGIPPDAPYYNSGVLLIELKEWKARRCAERVLDFMKHIRHDLMFGDQDYFSIVLSGDADILPPQYNFLTHFQMFTRHRDALRATGIPSSCWYGEEAFQQAQVAPIIHHFLGHTLGRPWYRESRNPLRNLYLSYAAKAGVPEVAEQSRPVEFCYRVMERCWCLLPHTLFAETVRWMYRYFFWSRYHV